jgi:hypothetical protein
MPLFEKVKAMERQKRALIATETQEAFVQEAKQMFAGVEVDWEKYRQQPKKKKLLGFFIKIRMPIEAGSSCLKK